jgi:hypothetical protein
MATGEADGAAMTLGYHLVTFPQWLWSRVWRPWWTWRPCRKWCSTCWRWRERHTHPIFLTLDTAPFLEGIRKVEERLARLRVATARSETVLENARFVLGSDDMRLMRPALARSTKAATDYEHAASEVQKHTGGAEKDPA